MSVVLTAGHSNQDQGFLSENLPVKLLLLAFGLFTTFGLLLTAHGIQSIVYAGRYRVAERFPVEVRVDLLHTIHE